MRYSHRSSLSAHLNNKPDRRGNRRWPGTRVWGFLRENVFDWWCQTLCTPSVLEVTLTLWLFCLEDIFLSECFCLSECRRLKMTIYCVTARLLSLTFRNGCLLLLFVWTGAQIYNTGDQDLSSFMPVKSCTASFTIFSPFRFIEEEMGPLRSIKKCVYCRVCALNNYHSDEFNGELS